MNLFVYGTLLFPEIRELVGGREFRAEPAYINGYRVLQVRDATFPGLLKSGLETDQADGEILLDLSPSELARFDAYEDSFYVRENVEVKFTDHDSRSEEEAMVYVVPKRLASTVLTEEPWTRDWFDKHHRAEFFARISGR